MELPKSGGKNIGQTCQADLLKKKPHAMYIFFLFMRETEIDRGREKQTDRQTHG